MSPLRPEFEYQGVLRQFNPWWQQRPIPDLPQWKRAAFQDLRDWAAQPKGRAILVSGARQVGKTTLLLQTIQHLLEQGVAPSNILNATFDHPLLRLAGLEETVRIWQESEPQREGPAYLFLDEIQLAGDWQVWVNHQVDFVPGLRIAFTGSASPLARDQPESGVGRWSTVQLPTLSFYEFLQIRKIEVPELPRPASLTQVLRWPEPDLRRAAHAAEGLTAHFHDYLVRGGFPECAQIEGVHRLQKLLREDIVDKVLKRDMTAFYGVRNVFELEKLFLYLCIQNGGEVNVTALSSELQVSRQVVENHLDLLVATHLLYPLKTFGYGKEVLKSKTKYYLADPSIAPGVLLKGREFLDDDTALGHAVEAAVFKHLYAHYHSRGARFSFWRDRRRKLEVDIVAEIGDQLVAFEVKYRNRTQAARDLAGLQAFCADRPVNRGYLFTRRFDDIGVMEVRGKSGRVDVLRIPAPLACFWLGASEQGGRRVNGQNRFRRLGLERFFTPKPSRFLAGPCFPKDATHTES